ncbi:MAG: hypothetical protein EDX89_07325 [Acidobacteria bacterium]|nr:MAG: hypothetical protein EDX89_07325 [Acidobacteriota bacterium]MCE7957096.1 hypothetical protein [Acidobacteria bacterium ACB2]
MRGTRRCPGHPCRPSAPVLAFAALIPALLAAGGAEAAGPAWQTLERDGVTLRYTPADSATAAAVLDAAGSGRKSVEAFFGKPFPKPFVVSVFPGRAELTDFWREEWKAPGFTPECWMVASGSAGTLSLLSPRAFSTEACDHDPSDARATRLLLAHELVHVYHSQVSPSADFDLEEIAWFAEGLATFASGQLDAGRLGRAREAVARGQGPKRLSEAWSGKERYGFAGSLVAYLDGRFGRATTVALLAETTAAGVLGRLGVSEEQLLDGWRRFLAAGGAR